LLGKAFSDREQNHGGARAASLGLHFETGNPKKINEPAWRPFSWPFILDEL